MLLKNISVSIGLYLNQKSLYMCVRLNG